MVLPAVFTRPPVVLPAMFARPPTVPMTIDTVVVGGCSYFRLHGAAPPLQPRPRGILQKERDFQIGQFESRLNPPPLIGVTMC